MSTDLLKDLRSRASLKAAWSRVKSNGLVSLSERTRKEIKRFDAESTKNLDRIYRQLLQGTYTFAAAEGIPQERKGKTPRPIVRHPVANRIVQRAILDVLQKQPRIKSILANPYSFGGIEARGVRHAIELACKGIKDGKSYFLRSDIKNFFQNIPRHTVISAINEGIADEQFRTLIEEATATELSNIAELKETAEIFPTHEIGVGQGCSLSPLFGNILLEEFDRRMNDRGILCVRYIDDFLMLGGNQKSVIKAFDSAQKLLSDYGLEAYDPRFQSDKSQMGAVNKNSSFLFLGCEVRPGMVRPSRDARTRLISKIKTSADDCKRQLKKIADSRVPTKKALAQTLTDIRNILKGWKDSYGFCNDQQVMKALDQKIDEQLRELFRIYRKYAKEADQGQKRRLWGIPPLTDFRGSPIQWN